MILADVPGAKNSTGEIVPAFVRTKASIAPGGQRCRPRMEADGFRLELPATVATLLNHSELLGRFNMNGRRPGWR
jgi:hypothetical protein